MSDNTDGKADEATSPDKARDNADEILGLQIYLGDGGCFPVPCEFTRESLSNFADTEKLVLPDLMRLFLWRLWESEVSNDDNAETVIVCPEVTQEGDIGAWLQTLGEAKVKKGIIILHRTDHYYALVVDKEKRRIEFKDESVEPEVKRGIAETVMRCVAPDVELENLKYDRSNEAARPRTRGSEKRGKVIQKKSEWMYCYDPHYRPSPGGLRKRNHRNACLAYSAMEVLRAIGSTGCNDINFKDSSFDPRCWFAHRVLGQVCSLGDSDVRVVEESRRWVFGCMASDLSEWLKKSWVQVDSCWPVRNAVCAICDDAIGSGCYYLQHVCCARRAHVTCIAGHLDDDCWMEKCAACGEAQNGFPVLIDGCYHKWVKTLGNTVWRQELSGLGVDVVDASAEDSRSVEGYASLLGKRDGAPLSRGDSKRGGDSGGHSPGSFGINSGGVTPPMNQASQASFNHTEESDSDASLAEEPEAAADDTAAAAAALSSLHVSPCDQVEMDEHRNKVSRNYNKAYDQAADNQRMLAAGMPGRRGVGVTDHLVAGASVAGGVGVPDIVVTNGKSQSPSQSLTCNADDVGQSASTVPAESTVAAAAELAGTVRIQQKDLRNVGCRSDSFSHFVNLGYYLPYSACLLPDADKKLKMLCPFMWGSMLFALEQDYSPRFEEIDGKMTDMNSEDGRIREFELCKEFFKKTFVPVQPSTPWQCPACETKFHVRGQYRHHMAFWETNYFCVDELWNMYVPQEIAAHIITPKILDCLIGWFGKTKEPLDILDAHQAPTSVPGTGSSLNSQKQPYVSEDHQQFFGFLSKKGSHKDFKNLIKNRQTRYAAWVAQKDFLEQWPHIVRFRAAFNTLPGFAFFKPMRFWPAELFTDAIMKAHSKTIKGILDDEKHVDQDFLEEFCNIPVYGIPEALYERATAEVNEPASTQTTPVSHDDQASLMS